MAYTSSRSSSSLDFEADSCAKSSVKAYATLKEQYDSLCSDYKKSQFNLVSYKAGLQSVEDILVHYKKNEAVFEESINVLKLKSLNDLLESQVINKFKTGLGYSTTTAVSPAVESFVNLIDMSGSDKGYHLVPLPLSGNFIPHKPDLTFMDEIVKSENLDVTTVVTPSNEKTAENKGVFNTVESNTVRRECCAPINEELVSDGKKKTVFHTVSKIEFVGPKQPEKPVRKPVKYAEMYRTNRVNAVKASACWVWRPIKPNSASITLKRYDYVDGNPETELEDSVRLNSPEDKKESIKKGDQQNASQIDMINGLLSKSNHEQRHHEKIETIIHTSADDQINSDIIFDDPYVDNNSG
ncbi:hypothetical protein Tco_0524801 [Tanacetum coccineum]